MKKYRIILLAILLIAIVSCASTQTAKIDYGPYPTNYQQLVINYYKARLYNPDGARFEFLKKPFAGCFPIYGISKLQCGWNVIVKVLAKDLNNQYHAMRILFLIKYGIVLGSYPM